MVHASTVTDDDFVAHTRRRLELLASADWTTKPPSTDHLAGIAARLTTIMREADAAWQLATVPAAKVKDFGRHLAAFHLLHACRRYQEGNWAGASISLFGADQWLNYSSGGPS